MVSCVYFNRTTKTLFEITSEKVIKFKFKGMLKSYQDSGIGTSNNGKLIIIGGTDSSKSLTNQVFIIDLINKTAAELPSLPKPTKGGLVFEYQTFYYFVGSSIEDDDGSIVGGPIMRYHIIDNL